MAQEFISVLSPDDTLGMPLVEGDLGKIADNLIEGDYLATILDANGNDLPGRVTVEEGIAFFFPVK